MVEKDIKQGICYFIYQYAKANNKYTKDYDRNKESSYIQYWDVNNLYGWAMSQKLPVNNFEWNKDTSQFSEDFLKNYNENNDEKYFLKMYMNFIMIYHFYQKKLKFKKSKSLWLIYLINVNSYTHKNFKTSIKSWISFEKS